jgi:hypothetical protein
VLVSISFRNFVPNWSFTLEVQLFYKISLCDWQGKGEDGTLITYITWLPGLHNIHLGDHVLRMGSRLDSTSNFWFCVHENQWRLWRLDYLCGPNETQEFGVDQPSNASEAKNWMRVLFQGNIHCFVHWFLAVGTTLNMTFSVTNSYCKLRCSVTNTELTWHYLSFLVTFCGDYRYTVFRLLSFIK